MRYYDTVISNQTRMSLFGQHFDYKQKKDININPKD